MLRKISPSARLCRSPIPKEVLVDGLVAKLQQLVLIVYFRHLDFCMNEIRLFLIELNIFENRIVRQSLVTELKLVECDAIHQQSQLNFAKISFSFILGVIAIWVRVVYTC